MGRPNRLEVRKRGTRQLFQIRAELALHEALVTQGSQGGHTLGTGNGYDDTSLSPKKNRFCRTGCLEQTSNWWSLFAKCRLGPLHSLGLYNQLVLIRAESAKAINMTNSSGLTCKGIDDVLANIWLSVIAPRRIELSHYVPEIFSWHYRI